MAEINEVLPGAVPVRLQSTPEILAKKLRHRLHGAMTVEARDVYDLAFALRADPVGLAEAKSVLSPDQRVEAAALIAHLPNGWLLRTNKPLVDPAADWGEAELAETLIEAIAGAAPVGRAPGPSP